jgi:biotin carboxyl carrier protein
VSDQQRDAVRRPARRDPETRARDHQQIDRLTDDLLPDLIDSLAASGLGELEVREDDWRIRLRLPGLRAATGDVARGADRAARGSVSTGSTASPPGKGQTAASGSPATAGAGSTAGNGATLSGPLALGATGVTAGTGAASAGAPGTPDGRSNGTNPSASGPHRVIAISPAVGIFQPRAELRAGARVRQGDRLGAVDLLGVPQDVVAPEDGIVVDTLAESGEGVEYGQDLVIIEPARGRHGADALPTTPVTES